MGTRVMDACFKTACRKTARGQAAVGEGILKGAY